jgi:hypothetical protein
MLLQRRQMTSANDITCSDDADPQFVVIFLHWLACDIDVARLGSIRCELTLTARAACAFNAFG